MTDFKISIVGSILLNWLVARNKKPNKLNISEVIVFNYWFNSKIPSNIIPKPLLFPTFSRE